MTYAMTIADMEMQVSSNLYGNLLGDAKKGAFSGWKIRAAYTAREVRMLLSGRAMVFHRQGLPDSPIKYFDLPIVGGHTIQKECK
jgi:hypothetical protein